MTTKRIVMMIMLAVALCQVSNAQRLDVFGGFNLAGMKHTISGERQDATGRFRYHFGMGVFVPFNAKDYKENEESAGIFPSLQYVKKGVSKSTIIDGYVADINLGYVQLTLPFSYIASSYGIGIGPYAGYCLSGNKKFHVGDGTTSKIDFENELKRLDYGASLHFQLGLFKIQYDLGLANLTRVAGESVKTRNFSVSLEIPIVE